MSSLFVQNLARAYRASVLNQDLKQPFLTSYHIITRSKTFVQPLVPNFKSPRLLNQLSSTLGNYWLEASPRERSCKVEPSAVVKIEPKAKKVNSKPKPKPKSSRKRKKNRSKVKSQQVSPVAPVVSPALAVAPNPPIEVVQVHLVPEVAADIPIAASPANSDDANQEDEDAEEHASQLIVELFGGTFSSSLDAITFRTAGFDTHNNVGTTRFHGSANEYEQEGLEFRKKLELDNTLCPDMISRHGQFTWDLRRQTVLYIIKTAKGAKMSNETLFLAINTFDRVLSSDSFLQIENIELETLCQIALACVLLAAKYFGDEYFHNKMVDGSFVKFKQDCFQKLLSNVKDCIQTKTLFLIERIVYKIINANLTSCDPMYFLVRDGSFISKERSISRVSWIMRMALLDQAFVSAKPSELVASSAFLAELSLGIEDWDETNFAFFGVSKPIVVKLAIKLRNYIIEMDEDDLNENDMCHLNTIEDVTGLEND